MTSVDRQVDGVVPLVSLNAGHGSAARDNWTPERGTPAQAASVWVDRVPKTAVDRPDAVVPQLQTNDDAGDSWVCGREPRGGRVRRGYTEEDDEMIADRDSFWRARAPR